MEAINKLREQFPETAKDMKLNLSNVLGENSLNVDQKWGTAVACAIATRNEELSAAVLLDAKSAGISEGALDDARAAATIMGMNNIYYRFLHFIEKDDYSQKRATLRMNYIARPKGEKADFELICLAVSAMNGCQACVNSHEKAVLDGGLSTDHVHDAVRIASVLQGSAISLEY
ncbi:MAG: alkyl hydroperoxide reductase [Ectothiorhodospiraceae bacterium]|nr:alkyl hydroperoxide reductase [Ectothiorhodospiraceae bacterium]